jgi:hypothetical protein
LTSTTTAPAAACVKNEQGTGCLPLAPESQRVDRTTPVFSRPTEITNPLVPVAAVAQSLQLGTVDGEPFRAEVTLLPGTKSITWNGWQVPTRIHQYVAYSSGRILEVALDWYAQADDGSVWYFGEDVFNYEDGVVADTHGTWLAGKDGPPSMTMPADPSPGQVYRPENIPKLVFEQVTVKSTGQTVPGPRGPVDGALVISELHLDGKTEAKSFAPGYGEFSAGGGGDLETVALAVPIDAAGGPPPAELATLTAGARAGFDAAGAGRWTAAASKVGAMAAAWRRLDGTDPPKLLARQMTPPWPRWPRQSTPATRPAPARPPSASSRPPSTSGSATGRRPRSTWPASTCGPASSRSTLRPRTPAPSPATWPPCRSSGTAPATPPPRRPPGGSARRCSPFAGRQTKRSSSRQLLACRPSGTR